ncbi:MAG: alpha/beta hydrolase [Legionellales bacterium]|jgi:pimeloyl-ACP methyl ester carboxylesterase
MGTIVLIPGHGCTPQVFDAQVRALSPQYRCICIDLRDYTTVDEVIADILNKAPDKFVILGFSLGAVIALQLAQQASDRIQGLIHISAPFEGPSDRLLQELPAICKNLPGMNFMEFINSGYQKYFPDRSVNDPLYIIFKQMLIDTGKKHYIDQAHMLLQPWSLKPSAHDTHPVLIIGGEHDHRALPEYHQAMHQQLKTSELHFIPNAKHFVTLEQPDLTNQVITNWLIKLAWHLKRQARL